MEDIQNMTDEQVLQRLLEADAMPEKTVIIPRLGIPVTLRALTGKQVFSMREQCTERKEKKGKVIEIFDEEQFNVGLISVATVKPNWADPKLLSKFKASGAEEVIKRILMAGELQALGDEVMKLSGYDIDLEDVKNE